MTSEGLGMTDQPGNLYDRFKPRGPNIRVPPFYFIGGLLVGMLLHALVASLDLNPQKARVLLRLALASGTTDTKQIQRYFEEY